MRIEKLHELVDQFSQKHILVVGDLMLDSYMWGSTNRISPEAPVPVVSIDKTTHSPGGAANVGWNISSLSAKVSMVGIIGEDTFGDQLLEIMSTRGIKVEGVVKDSGRKTTVKTRIIAQGQQVVRTDLESLKTPSDAAKESVYQKLSSIMEEVDGIIIADYNKGLLSADMIDTLLSKAISYHLPVYVDPKKDHYFEYKDVRLFKPNSVEFKQSMNQNVTVESANELRHQLNADYILITIGADGMLLITDEGHFKIPTKARAVHDVSGAGDTVISLFTLADLSGASPEEAAILANLAAGRVCEEVGVMPINLDMLNEIFNHHQPY